MIESHSAPLSSFNPYPRTPALFQDARHEVDSSDSSKSFPLACPHGFQPIQISQTGTPRELASGLIVNIALACTGAPGSPRLHPAESHGLLPSGPQIVPAWFSAAAASFTFISPRMRPAKR